MRRHEPVRSGRQPAVEVVGTDRNVDRRLSAVAEVDIPFYVTATALGKLGNPEGEVILTRGAKNRWRTVPTWLSTWPFSQPAAGVQATGSTR